MINRKAAWLVLSLALLGGKLQAAPSVEVLERGLEHPWALAFLPDGQAC